MTSRIPDLFMTDLFMLNGLSVLQRLCRSKALVFPSYMEPLTFLLLFSLSIWRNAWQTTFWWSFKKGFCKWTEMPDCALGLSCQSDLFKCNDSTRFSLASNMKQGTLKLPCVFLRTNTMYLFYMDMIIYDHSIEINCQWLEMPSYPYRFTLKTATFMNAYGKKYKISKEVFNK